MLIIDDGTRDELARILEEVAKDGMPHPRNLDAALDAILCTLTPEETDETIIAWCRQTFGPEENDVSVRYARLLEEVIELGVALGIPSSRITDIAWISLAKSADSFNKSEEVPGEAADTDLTLTALLGALGLDRQKIRIERMRRNRARPDEYYHERIEAKKAMGL